MATPEPELRRKRKDIFLAFAPAHDLPFPTRANITAYELLAFLPNTIQCPDVIKRFASNGATRSAVWAIINTARDLEKEWNVNRCGAVLTKTMNDAGWIGWTLTHHDKWNEATKDSWNEADLRVDNFRTREEMFGRARSEENVPFESLAIGVRRPPQDAEALDLTRMVRYCVQRPGSGWLYPRDYERLLNLLGGPAPIQKAHLDRLLFKTWDNLKPAPPRVWSAEDHQAAKASVDWKNRKTISRVGTPVSEQVLKEPTSIATIQRQAKDRPKKRTRLERMDLKAEKTDEEDEEEVQFESYERAAANYVEPEEVAIAPAELDVAFAFATDRDVGETDPFGAYAFGGPRHRAPYRMLHHIQQPNDADTSGWAENLRWAFEQRACFWHAQRAYAWNESPTHMELIAEIRERQVWASDQLVAELVDE
ncbi:hypothetical protein BDU57DRAFT_340116 [Ampelomyces quisqualis]|uniref:Uncharacterized protein n=1 Tax=Ampelomyces quisqualis TaxID=50730 RepID=A0A6A5QC67_AMPQU|nr:hypothetical protein BDU57DRAFT_340116 [Ampelomyces quisqualis]